MKKICFKKCWNCGKKVLCLYKEKKTQKETVYLFHNADKCLPE